jgi:hypothetical protein
VAKVGHLTEPEGTLGVLHEQLVLLECVEDEPNVLEVLCPRSTVDEYVVEEDEHEAADEWPQHLIHQCLKGCRGVR